jgi:serine/threonine-protein kinase HipA
MAHILDEFRARTPEVIQRVQEQIPAAFPLRVSQTILNGFKARATRLHQ